MSISIEKTTDFNPYAAPIGSPVESPQRVSNRASLKKLRDVNLLTIVADLSYVAFCCSMGAGLTFFRGEAAQCSFIAACITLFLLWYTVVAALFRAKGFSAGSTLTPFLLPIPLIGTGIFLFAKEDIRQFMIANGYRPRFLGFGIDEAQRQAMEQDANYTPSQSTHHDGSKRQYIFSLAECWIILGLGLYLLQLVSTYFLLLN